MILFISFNRSIFSHFHSVLKSPKISHFNFWNLAFSNNFRPIKRDISGNAIWPQGSVFQKLATLTIYGILNELLSTKNVNVSRFACNVNFFCDILTLHFVNFVRFCPYCLILLMLSDFVHIVWFCPYFPICPYCPILSLFSNLSTFRYKTFKLVLN